MYDRLSYGTSGRVAWWCVLLNIDEEGENVPLV